MIHEAPGVTGELQREIGELVAFEITSLRGMDYVLKDGKRRRVGCSGSGFLSSGHRLTSVFGTIVNRVVCLLALEDPLVTQALGRGQNRAMCHQGDDMALVLGGVSEREAWRVLDGFSAAVAQWGFVVNPSKCSVCPGGVEFLRLWICERGVMGYPGRMLRSLFWRKPVSDAEVVNWLGRLKEELTTLRVALRRGVTQVAGLGQRVIRAAVPRYLGRREGDRVLRWCSTPLEEGGGGGHFLLAAGARTMGWTSPGSESMHLRPWSRRGEAVAPELGRPEGVRVIEARPADGGLWSGAAARGLGRAGGSGLGSRRGDPALAERIGTLLLDRVPLGGARGELKWVELGVRSEVVRAVAGVRPDTSGWDTPEVFCTWRDGPGWWRKRILAESAFRRGGGRTFDFGEVKLLGAGLSERYRRWCQFLNVNPISRARISWLVDERSPPGVGDCTDELSLIQARLRTDQWWRPRHRGAVLSAHFRRMLVLAKRYNYSGQ